MTVETLEKIAKYLNVPVSYFFDDNSLTISQSDNDTHGSYVSIAANVFEQISHLTQTVLSQQQTIEFLCKKTSENIAVGA